MQNDFLYKFVPPHSSLNDFVESIGMFQNPSHEAKDIAILPDGRVDLFFSRSGTNPFQVMLMGLETAPKQRSVPPDTLTFSVSFKPLALEYILHQSIADVLNSGRQLPDNFWNFNPSDLDNFESYRNKITQIIRSLLPETIDKRKHRLFELIYASKGELSVKELSEEVAWSSRQINRYFSQWLGLSLKAFSDILRFRASLEHIAKGRLFPELDFTDQNHFIKEIKKFSGVVPGELSKNKDDRFILLSVLKQK